MWRRLVHLFPYRRHSIVLHFRLTSYTLPLVLATSSTLRRNNGANCFASVQRKLVLTGARAMIHTLDLRDARVRVGGARFTLPTSPAMRNQTLQKSGKLEFSFSLTNIWCSCLNFWTPQKLWTLCAVAVTAKTFERRTLSWIWQCRSIILRDLCSSW